MLLSCVLSTLLSPLTYLNIRSVHAAPQSQSKHLKADEIPTVSFCEMVKNPQAYFGRLVRTRAVWERATEGIFLRDRACEEQVKVGFSQAPVEKWCERAGTNFKTIYDEKFAGRAEIVVRGTLENRRSKNPFFNYRYLFVATCIEKVMRAGDTYEGKLEEGQTYRARVKCDSEQEGLSLLIPVEVPYHHAVRIEWANLKKYPQLKARAGADCEREIVFQVVSKQIEKVAGQRRWNVTYNCKIVRAE